MNKKNIDDKDILKLLKRKLKTKLRRICKYNLSMQEIEKLNKSIDDLSNKILQLEEELYD